MEIIQLDLEISVVFSEEEMSQYTVVTQLRKEGTSLPLSLWQACSCL